MLIKKFLFGMAMLFTASAFAQQTRPADAASKDVPQNAQALEMAGRLIKYGYQTKTALPLIQAVEIFKKCNVCDEISKKPKKQLGEDLASNISKTDVVSFDEKQLLADATRFADGNKSLLALISDAEKSTRGVTPKCIKLTDKVLANGTDIWEFTFRGDELALVMVIGDGDSDLDLYIYDENENLIVSDENPGDNCTCTFIPEDTGTYSIVIVNTGRIYNRYTLITN